jgi:hypothetical protein
VGGGIGEERGLGLFKVHIRASRGNNSRRSSSPQCLHRSGRLCYSRVIHKCFILSSQVKLNSCLSKQTKASTYIEIL